MFVNGCPILMPQIISILRCALNVEPDARDVDVVNTAITPATALTATALKDRWREFLT